MKSTAAAKLTSALLLSSVFLLNSPALADHGSGSGRENENEPERHGADDPANHDNPAATPTPRATPTPTATPPPIASAQGVFRARVDSTVKAKRGVVSRVDFKADLYLSIPSLSVGIASDSDATTAAVELSVSRGGVQYAICELELNKFEREHRVRFAQFRVDLRNEVKKGTLRTKLHGGSCDTDLATPGANNLAPDLNFGDVVEFSVNGLPISVVPEFRIR